MKIFGVLSRWSLMAVFFLPFYQAEAQDMYVGSGGVYVNNTVLCVTNGLKLDGNMYLRSGAQLVQNHSGASSNSGAGVLSVYQEGTVNNYQYNLWCSPVGDPTLTAVNGNYPFHISMLGRPLDNLTTQSAQILGMTQGKDGLTATGTGDHTNGYLKIASYWVFNFKASSSYSEWTDPLTTNRVADGYMDAGLGFTMKGSAGSDNVVADSNDKIAYYPGGSVDYSQPPYNLAGIPNNPDGSHQRYDFRGMPNSGDISIGIEPDSFTLIGNPYPSVIDLDLFFSDLNSHAANGLGDNLDTDGVAYFWEQYPANSHQLANYVAGYGVYSAQGFDFSGSSAPPGTVFVPSSGVYVPATFFKFASDGTYVTCTTCPSNTGNPDRRFVPVGQGFMVKGVISTTVSGTLYPTDEKVYMKNSYRLYKTEGVTANGTGSVFSKNTASGSTDKDKLPQIRFSMTYDGGSVGEMVQVFHPNASVGFNRGDVINPNNYPVMVNFLVDEYYRCVINSMPFDMNASIPLIFDNQNEASYKITIKEMINVDQISNVYLHDKTADVYYDIKNDFASLTLPGGMNWEQYEITFKNNTLGVDDLIEKSFVVYQDNTAKKMMVSNPELKGIAACDLYDIAGKLVFSKKQLGSNASYEFSTAELRDGIYIAKVTSKDNKTKSQKIIVKY